MASKMSINQALIKFNNSQIEEPLDILYQTAECYRCQPHKIMTLNKANISELTLETKDYIRLELRNSASNVMQESTLCEFPNLSLISQAQYMINITRVNGKTKCSIASLQEGECYYCPILTVCALLIAITLFESLIAKFINRRRSSYSSKISEITLEAEPDVDQVNETSNPDEINTQFVDTNDNGDNNISKPKRIDALDAFRGLTIVGMIMVNYGGAGYIFLEHSPWNGIRLADFVFPFFIFSMGSSIGIATRSMVRKGLPLTSIMFKILKRSLILMALGLCLNSKWLGDDEGLARLRLTGVLQRFSISYFVVALIYSLELVFKRSVKATDRFNRPILYKSLGIFMELLTGGLSLAVYIYFTFFFQYNNECPAGYVGPGGETEEGKFENCTGGAASWLDKTILGSKHLYNDRELEKIFKTKISHDPEGLLGYSTSIVLTLIGLQCGKIMVKNHGPKMKHKMKLIMLLRWACFLLPCSFLSFAEIVPINKKLWSITFVTATGSAAILILSLFYIYLDVLDCHRAILIKLIIAAGKNSIFLYVGHSLLYGMLPWRFAVDNSSRIRVLAQLLWSTFVWLLISAYLSKKRLFIRI